MSNDVDPQSPGREPDPFRGVNSGGSPGQLRGPNDVEPGGTTAQPGGFEDSDLSPQSKEPLPEYFSAPGGPPLPPVIEAFPGHHDVQQPPRKTAEKVVGSRRIRWPAVAIGVAGVAVVLVVVMITVLLTNRHGAKPGQSAAPPTTTAAPPPSTSPPPTLTTPEQLNGILLSADAVNVTMGASTIQLIDSYEQLDPTPITLSNPDCQGALYAMQGPAYAGSGQTAVRAQVLSEPGRFHAHWVNQAAVTFASGDDATRFVQNSADKWKNCANRTVTVTNSKGETFRWSFTSLNGRPPNISLSDLQEGASNNWGCQHALSAVSNVVIDVNACGYHIASEGRQLADKMVAKVAGQ
ncbi:sensor domain-containing protein [Mycobacterium kansasii]|uniref:sensor domain-containing protein n=1 Tax=Mycobacterium kansasii TaxID=1768 RepID=UPI0012EC3B9A|nr:sensor domain-containing protein [Mycobacterium kansasii]